MTTGNRTISAEASANKKLIGRNVLDCIGNTPLLRLERLGPNFPNAEFYGKAEWFNPGGSVKDRPALEMIRDAERTGKLKPGQTILDATSGNTGIAYAMIASALGYRVKLCLPTSASEERKKILHAFGAELVLTPSRMLIFILTSTAMIPTGALITRPPRTKSGSRRVGKLRTSLRDSARAEHLWAQRAASRN
jgi:hypothetical protein